MINWIYVGPQPTIDYFKGIDSFIQNVPGEQMCLWVSTDDFAAVQRLLSAKGGVIVREINFMELCDQLRVPLQESLTKSDMFRDEPESFWRNIDWFQLVSKKILAFNLIKELFQPLMLAYCSAQNRSAHYFDLSSTCLPGLRIGHRLPEWHTFKICQPGDSPYGYDVFWMFIPSSSQRYIQFCTDVFVHMIENLLETFPNFNLEDSPHLKRIQIVKYLRSLNACYKDVRTRVDTIVNIFFYEYAKALKELSPDFGDTDTYNPEFVLKWDKTGSLGFGRTEYTSTELSCSKIMSGAWKTEVDPKIARFFLTPEEIEYLQKNGVIFE